MPNPVPPAAPRARWRLSPPPSPALDALGDPLLARALAARGVAELDGAAAFLGRSVGDDNPFRLADMDRAVTRLRRAISGGERIAVYGDYDADGVTGTALLTTALRALGGDVLPHLPHRERDGYGVHTAALDRLAKHGVRLVVTVDCGVRAAEPLLHARTLGMDVIVTDHHALPDELPAAVAVVNPRRADDGYGFHEFAGVGLAYKLAQALLRVAARTSARPAALHETDLLDLAAIGTVADVVPLVGENRMLVQGGLERIRAGARPGVAALCEAGGFEAATMTARGIAFGLGPRLNAAGRMGDATMALTLLLSEADGEARRLAAQLEHMNRERRAATDVALEAAHADLAGRTDAPFLAWASPDVGLGVIGLVAGQLADRLPGVDMLRGLAVAGGVCNHLGAYLQVQVPWIGRLGGLLGVELFFVISGYLIAGSCAALPPGPYLVRRAFRIFPVYWAVVLALTALGPVGQRLAGAPAGDWFAFLLNLLALSHLYPPALAGFDVTAVSWSLTVELGWYLVAPLLALLWGMRPTTGVDARQAASRLAQAAPGPRAPAGRKAVTGTVLVFVAVSVAWVWLAQRGAFDRVFLEVLWAGQVGPMTDFLRYAYLVNAAPAHLVFFAAGAALATCAPAVSGGPAIPERPGAAGLPDVPAAVAVAAVPGARFRRLGPWLAAAAIALTLPWADRVNAVLNLNPSPVPVLGLAALFLLIHRVAPAAVGAGLVGPAFQIAGALRLPPPPRSGAIPT